MFMFNQEMHSIRPKPILHRDIRWPNIVLHDEKFILIDFDYATFGSEKKGIVRKALDDFSETGHAPETLTGKHDRKVDIQGVGYLIDLCNIKGIPRRLKKFASKVAKQKSKTLTKCFGCTC